MPDEVLILRKWTGVIRSSDEAAYIAYVSATGTSDYEATPGNRGFQLLIRPLGDGRSEVTTLSWWDSLDAIRGFAGEDIEAARYYPDDDRFLLERPPQVEHHQVVQRSSAIG